MTIECPECGEVFADESSFRPHYGNKHDPPLPWKDGIEKYGSYYQSQREKALERDGGRCRRCGEINAHGGEERELRVHHIKKVDEFDDMENAHALRNLVSVCTQCHEDIEGLPIAEQLDELGLDSRFELRANEGSDDEE